MGWNRMEWDGTEWNGTKKDRMECGGIDIERMISAGNGRSDDVQIQFGWNGRRKKVHASLLR